MRRGMILPRSGTNACNILRPCNRCSRSFAHSRQLRFCGRRPSATAAAHSFVSVIPAPIRWSRHAIRFLSKKRCQRGLRARCINGRTTGRPYRLRYRGLASGARPAAWVLRRDFIFSARRRSSSVRTGHMANDEVAHAQAAFDFGDLAAAALDVEQRVDPFVELVDRIGKPAAAQGCRPWSRFPPWSATTVQLRG